MEATLDSTTLEKEENGMKTIEKWERSVSISEEALRKVVREELYKVVRETRKIDDAQAELEIVSLMKRKIREADTDGHEVDEAVLEGGVKVRPKIYDISKV